jgi:hypothetical protein
MSWDTNVGNRMQVVVQGKTYEFYLDGVLISEPVTMDHLPLGGYFGLFSRGPSIFRDIRLNTFSKSDFLSDLVRTWWMKFHSILRV